MKTIVVPVDLSAATVHVCSAAADLAQALNSRLVIVHAMPPLSAISTQGFISDTQLVEYNRKTRKATAHKMKALGRWFARRCPATKVFLHEGDPFTVVTRTIRQTHPDYVVIGSHGHGAMYDLLVGSIAYRIIRNSPCPVVLVPITKKTGRPGKKTIKPADSIPWMLD